ncbi:transglutaminase-like putative cysteine protease [Anaerotaenia torta]|uniref:transglutaminase domain-containing protein n=1 Tax=Anaerotaenia torta TaxID=433293 RepID=UPI003D1EB84B
MRFQRKTIDKIEQDYNQAIPFFGYRAKGIQERINKLSPEEALFMKYLYAYMPLSDVGAYDFDVFYGYAKHTAYLLESSLYMKDIPEDYIFNYVLSHRINSEDITDCRRFFFDLVKDRIRDLPLKEAVLEINNWCYEQATYRSTSIRTASPVTVYKGGFGRCGEESTFLVTILRSVGIAARQIYVPRWSHSDSNHAWVEIWDGEQWYFTGACEPKPIFNNGWFTYAASRAMVVHSRVFSGFGCEGEEIAEQDGTVTLINNSSRYAMVKPFTVIVKNEKGEPVKGALIRFEIINSAEFFPITTLKTNEKGTVSIRLGKGDIHLHVLHNGRGKMKIVSVKDHDEISFLLDGEEELNFDQWNKFRIGAPDCAEVSAVDMTPEQEREQDERNKLADVLRQNRINSYYDEAYGKQFESYAGIARALSEAKGNFDEIRLFLEEKVSGHSLEQKDLLLSVLARKDFRDTKAEVLISHLEGFQYQGNYEDEIFSRYVLSPNVYMEKISAFRAYIRNEFGHRGEELSKHPEKLWEYIQSEITYYPEREYGTIIGTPESTMNVKAGTPMSKKVLFVAICRTYGLAARLDELYLEPQYFDGEKFVFVDEKQRKAAHLQLSVTEGKIPLCYQQFTLGYRKEDGSYETLELWNKEFTENKLCFTLLPGVYRILTNERMASGSIIGAEYYFALQEGEQKEVNLYSDLVDPKELRMDYELGDFSLQTLEGEVVSSRYLCGEGKNLLLFIEAGKEPTEHLFNEMLEMAKMSGLQNSNIHIVVKDDQEFKDDTFIKVCNVYNNLSFWKDENDEALSLLEEITGVDKKKLPVCIVMEGHQKGLYACCGYQVGSVDMFARVIG